MKKIKDIINLDAHTAAIEKYNLTVKHISSVEIEFGFNNGNWINIWYREKGAPEGDQLIYFDSNIEAYGYEQFKHPWKLGENIEDFLFSCAIPTMSLLNGSQAFPHGTTELEDALVEAVKKKGISPTVEKRLLSFKKWWWDKKTARKSNLEYDGTAIGFSYKNANINFYIPAGRFVYIEFEKDGEKFCFDSCYFVSLATPKEKFAEELIDTVLRCSLKI